MRWWRRRPHPVDTITSAVGVQLAPYTKERTMPDPTNPTPDAPSPLSGLSADEIAQLRVQLDKAEADLADAGTAVGEAEVSLGADDSDVRDPASGDLIRPAAPAPVEAVQDSGTPLSTPPAEPDPGAPAADVTLDSLDVRVRALETRLSDGAPA